MEDHLRIGIVSDEISSNFEEAVEYGMDWGIRDYEIRCLDTGRIPYADKEEIEHVIKLINNNGLNINALSPGFFKIRFSDRENLRKEISEGFEKTFILADRLKTNKIILFGGKREENWDSGDYDRAVDILNEIAETGKRFGFTFVIENEPGFWLDTGENSAKILQIIDSEYLRLNWDPGNAVLCGETVYPDGYNYVKDYIRNFHVKEGRLKESGEWEFLTIDNGLIDWENMIMDLKKDTDIKILTVETHCEPLIENSKIDIDILKKILANIQG
ncbi:sugar phosphate isomerase/epimerase family protein [candidate division KSB1 bacterium]